MTQLPAMTPPPEGVKVEKCVLNYFDGSSREIFFTDAQYIIPNNMMIVSRTDAKGFITHVNVDFMDASGYDKEELIGQPHYILRHPHMPRSGFQEMWETLHQGNIWTGAVKNLRKDGGFYWVQAVVKPLEENGKIVGFHSVRKRLDPKKVAEYEALYASMRVMEEDPLLSA